MLARCAGGITFFPDPTSSWAALATKMLHLQTTLSFLAQLHIASSITCGLNLAVSLTKAKDSRNISSTNPSNLPLYLGQRTPSLIQRRNKASSISTGNLP